MATVKESERTIDDEQLAEMVARARAATTRVAREEILDGLIAVYEQVATGNPQAARNIRRAFLLALEQAGGDPAVERFSHFLAEQVEPQDFETIRWQYPKQEAIEETA